MHLQPATTGELVAKNECKYVSVAEKEVCRGLEHLEAFFQDVLDKGGEGVILRDPLALLQPGRSPGYLKHKVSFGPPSS